jgi:predicted dehydrogenase
MHEVISQGQLGEIRRVRTWMCFPLPRFKDIRYNHALAGGSLMDGCYAAHCLRLLGPGEPTVTSARAKLRGADIDRAMTATVRFDNGAEGRLDTSMWSHRVLRLSAHVEGTRGRMRVTNYVGPQYFNLMSVTVDGRTTRSRVRGEASYDAQLRAFHAAVDGDGNANLTPPADAVATMRLIDDCYRMAGLRPRG